MVGDLGWMLVELGQGQNGRELGQNGWRTRPEWLGARPGELKNCARVVRELG